MAKNQTQEQTPNINIIGKGTSIVGEMKIEGDIRIDGHVNGKLHGAGRVIIGVSGMVEGEIQCQNIEISGKMTGTIMVSGQLLLKNTAKVEGEIRTEKIGIEPGAVFSGNCKMGSESNKMNTQTINVEKKENREAK